MGIGAPAETFSNIKTPSVGTKPATKTSKTAHLAAPRAMVRVARRVYQPRYLAHLGLAGFAAALVLTNNPAWAHALTVRLTAAQAGAGTQLDEATPASVPADVASQSHFMISSAATKTATVKNEQVALVTADDSALSKRLVVATAGNATRDITNYTVQPGDTLSGIASKFGITTSTVLWANSMDDGDAIKPGQSLVILPVSGLLYTVASGDTADSLAAKYGANAAQITSYNNAEVKGLVPGTKIIIPDGVKPADPKPAVQLAVASRYTTSSAAPRLTYYAGGGNGYAFGYCTWYVATRRSIPSNWGNANQWLYAAQASGFSTGSVPVPGAIAWTGAGYYGHVAYVESVSGSMVTVSEMNFNGNWDRVTSRTVSASSFRYIY